MPYTHLTENERYVISHLTCAGFSWTYDHSQRPRLTLARETFVRYIGICRKMQHPSHAN